MSGMETVLLAYLANSLWQAPLLAAAGWLAVRLLKRLGPAAEHRAWVAVLLAQSAFPALALLHWERLAAMAGWGRHAANADGGQVAGVVLVGLLGGVDEFLPIAEEQVLPRSAHRQD